MNTAFTKIQWFRAVVASVMGVALLAGATSRADAEEVGVEVKPVRADKLLNVPGKTLTAIVVNYAPGGKSSRRKRVRLCALGRNPLGELRNRTGQSLQDRRELLRATGQ